MNIVILTLFPGMFEGFLSESILKRAIQAGHLSVELVNFRDYAINKHKVVDAIPYGGGAGMVLKPEPLIVAIEDVKQRLEGRTRVILLSPQGETFLHKMAQGYIQWDNLIFICGHYEGFDERIRSWVDQEVSLGDFIVTGGELPAMVITDAVTRLLLGVLGNPDTHREESFYEGLLEGPHYTRPEEFRGMKVPKVLLSGHHQKIAEWRKEQALKRTQERRPDLLSKLKK